MVLLLIVMVLSVAFAQIGF